jgi:hypothetical protein
VKLYPICLWVCFIKKQLRKVQSGIMNLFKICLNSCKIAKWLDFSSSPFVKWILEF